MQSSDSETDSNMSEDTNRMKRVNNVNRRRQDESEACKEMIASFLATGRGSGTVRQRVLGHSSGSAHLQTDDPDLSSRATDVANTDTGTSAEQKNNDEPTTTTGKENDQNSAHDRSSVGLFENNAANKVTTEGKGKAISMDNTSVNTNVHNVLATDFKEDAAKSQVSPENIHDIPVNTNAQNLLATDSKEDAEKAKEVTPENTQDTSVNTKVHNVLATDSKEDAAKPQESVPENTKDTSVNTNVHNVLASDTNEDRTPTGNNDSFIPVNFNEYKDFRDDETIVISDDTSDSSSSFGIADRNDGLPLRSDHEEEYFVANITNTTKNIQQEPDGSKKRSQNDPPAQCKRFKEK